MITKFPFLCVFGNVVMPKSIAFRMIDFNGGNCTEEKYVYITGLSELAGLLMSVNPSFKRWPISPKGVNISFS